MRLLIVDDQKAVVDGLLRQDWSASGITHVIGVHSAAEARRILAEYVVDVMLCDIEMPVEDGLSLVKWVRDQGIMAKCIFLTAHMEFSYAQKSVGLGAFDYVVQPAPYDEIRRAVERATRTLQQENQQRHQQKYGQISGWKNKAEVAAVLRRYLTEGNEEPLQAYIRRGELPGEELDVYLIYMQIQRWFSFEEWSDNLLSMMMDNVVSEVFSPSGKLFASTMMGKDQFALLLWNPRETNIHDRITHQLSFLYNVCRKQIKCTLALYPAGPIHMSQLPNSWQELLLTQKNNVQMKAGVMIGDGNPIAVRRNVEPDRAAKWQEMLTGASSEQPDQVINDWLLRLCGHLSEESATSILYDELLATIHRITGDADKFWRNVLVDTQSYDIYRNAAKQPESLKKLVKLVQTHLGSKNMERDERIVETIRHYIDKHMDQEIHRSDLADYVYLNPDYLNRLFKKQTGKTLKEYVIEYKMLEARKMLQVTSLPVSIIAAKVGYDNFSHFSYAYKKVVGQSPMETRTMARKEKEAEESK